MEIFKGSKRSPRQVHGIHNDQWPRIFLSEVFGNKQIAFRESSKGAHLINLYFRQFRIGQIDIEKRVFTFKRAYLIDGNPRGRAPEQ